MQTSETIIDRVRRMELYFDMISQAISSHSDALNDPLVKTMLDALKAYYDSGQWLADYIADERGELPSDLKRGVLSQDGVYNLLCEIEDRKKTDGSI